MENARSDEIMGIQTEISILQSQLASEHSDIGDWKVAKCYEYALAGLESPYDFAELHSKRQAARDEINRLKERLKELESQPAE